MKLEDVIRFNNILKNEIDAEISKICTSTNQTDIDEELILQDKLISLLLILRHQPAKPRQNKCTNNQFHAQLNKYLSKEVVE